MPARKMTHGAEGRHTREGEAPARPDGSNVMRFPIRPVESGRAHGLVLVVDDEPAIRSLCSLALRGAGFDVAEAEDGSRGLELALALVPDAILSDVEMPRRDGFDLALSLRHDERTSAIPVVFLSGETGAAERACARGVRAAAFVSKPFDPLLLPPLLSRAIAWSAACEAEATAAG